MNHIAKNNLLRPIVDAFVTNGDRYNLLHWAVLELFECICKDNLKILLKYLVDSCWDDLVKFEKFSSVHSLKVKYEQSLESPGMRSVGNLLDTRKQVDECGLEKEEDYFNEDSDEEDSASASVANASRVQSQPVVPNRSASRYSSVRSGGLVDYENDEDDEDYRPPSKKQSDISGEDGVESFPLKRKVSPKDPDPKRLQRAAKGSKSRGTVFTALCSTLSQTVLPSKKTVSAADNGSTAQGSPGSDGNKRSIEANHEEKGNVSNNGNADSDNCLNKLTSPRSFSESLHNSPDKGQHGEDCPLIPKSSPEMAVNGS